MLGGVFSDERWRKSLLGEAACGVKTARRGGGWWFRSHLFPLCIGLRLDCHRQFQPGYGCVDARVSRHLSDTWFSGQSHMNTNRMTTAGMLGFFFLFFSRGHFFWLPVESAIRVESSVGFGTQRKGLPPTKETLWMAPIWTQLSGHGVKKSLPPAF